MLLARQDFQKSLIRKKQEAVQALKKMAELATVVALKHGRETSPVNHKQILGGLIPKTDDRDLYVFKSSGTAMQDLVVACRIYGKAVERDLGSVIYGVPNFRTLR